MERIPAYFIGKAAFAGAVLAFVFGATAVPAAEGYVVDGLGKVVRSSEGCVHTRAWDRSDAIAQCEPQLAEAAEVAALQDEADPEPREAAAERTERITLEADTNFDFDAVTLTEEGKRILDQLAETVKGTREAQVDIVGYADRIGPEDYNLELSKRRAEAVKEYLVGKGVSEHAIQVSARGEDNPVVDCADLSGQSLIECLRPNRRSEIEFSAFEVVEEQQPDANLQERSDEPEPRGDAE